jgi:transcriptional regulator with XRE-family HTH domain
MKILQKIRQKYKTDKAMADDLGVCQATVSQWVNGKRKPDPENQKKLRKKHVFDMDKLRAELYD